MYEVSSSYLDAIFNSTNQYLTGTVTLKDGSTIDLNASNLHSNSVALEMQAVTSDSLEFGAAVFGTLEVGILTDESRYALYNATVELTFHKYLEDDSVVAIPLGIYTVAEATKSGKYLKLTSYDNISKLGKSYPGTTISGTPFELMTFIAKECEVELAENKAYYESLVNGKEVIGIDSDSGCSTYRDIVTAIGQMCGVFFQANRAGKISARKFHSTPDFTMSLGWRYSSIISDYVCIHNKLTASGQAGTFVSTIGTNSQDFIEMIIDEAPAWDDGLKDTLQARTNNLLSYLNTIRYTPTEITTFSNPAFDCGDMIEVETLDGSSVNTLITSYIWRFSSAMDIESVGRNPYFADAKQSTSQRRGGGGSSSKNKVIVHTYTNAPKYKITHKDKQIIGITYAAETETTALFNATIQVNMDLDGYFVITYYKGLKELESLKHYLPKGYSIVTIHKYMESTEPELVALKIVAHTEYVESDIRVQNAKILSMKDWIDNQTPEFDYKYVEKPVDKTVPQATIESEGIRASLHAQGISAGTKWDGILELEDSVGVFKVPSRVISSVTTVRENIDFRPNSNIIRPNINENVSVVQVPRRTITLICVSENVNIEEGV